MASEAQDLIKNALQKGSGYVFRKEDHAISVVRSSRGKIIFHDITNGGVDVIGQRQAVVKVQKLIEDGYTH